MHRIEGNRNWEEEMESFWQGEGVKTCLQWETKEIINSRGREGAEIHFLGVSPFIFLPITIIHACLDYYEFLRKEEGESSEWCGIVGTERMLSEKRSEDRERNTFCVCWNCWMLNEADEGNLHPTTIPSCLFHDELWFQQIFFHNYSRVISPFLLHRLSTSSIRQIHKQTLTSW